MLSAAIVGPHFLGLPLLLEQAPSISAMLEAPVATKRLAP